MSIVERLLFAVGGVVLLIVTVLLMSGERHRSSHHRHRGDWGCTVCGEKTARHIVRASLRV